MICLPQFVANKKILKYKKSFWSRVALKPRQNRELSIELTKQFVSFGDFK